MDEVLTERLRLVPATVERAEGELRGVGQLAKMIGAGVDGEAWPAAGWDEERLSGMRDALRGDRLSVGWWGWYVVLRAEMGEELLIGVGGFEGVPEPTRELVAWISVLPGYDGGGYAAEALAGLVHHVATTGRVDRVVSGAGELTDKAIFNQAGFRLDKASMRYVWDVRGVR